MRLTLKPFILIRAQSDVALNNFKELLTAAATKS
jgi:hypothetical protein